MFTALYPVESFMPRDWLFADCDDGKRHPQEGLSGAVFIDGWMDGWIDSIAGNSSYQSRLSCQNFLFGVRFTMLPEISMEKRGGRFTAIWLMEPRPGIHGCFAKASRRLSSDHERCLGVKLGGPAVFREPLEYRK